MGLGREHRQISVFGLFVNFVPILGTHYTSAC